MKQITPKQKELWNYIVSCIRKNGLPPTVSEMAKALKVKSKNAVAKLLMKLEEAGLIERDGTARGIKVFDEFGNEIKAGLWPVPVLGSIPAGGPVMVEEHIEKWINLPYSLIQDRRDVFLLKVRGDSMEGTGILDGDLVIVKPTKEVKSEDIVVALLHDEVTVKRFVEINGRQYLKPENPKYQNIYPVTKDFGDGVYPEDEWTIQGKVIGVIRDYEYGAVR